MKTPLLMLLAFIVGLILLVLRGAALGYVKKSELKLFLAASLWMSAALLFAIRWG